MNKSVPAEINNNSKAIFIAQAPGVYENEKEVPLIGDISDKRTAGMIVQEILNDLGYSRTDFSYTNSYDKYPGKNTSNRDEKPSKKMLEEQRPRLLEDIKSSNSGIIITVGKLAEKNLKEMLKDKNYANYFNDKKIVNADYPNNCNKEKLKQQIKSALD